MQAVTFDFQATIFQMDGYFYWSRHSQEVLFRVLLDSGIEASLRLPSLAREFGIDDESQDAHMLKRVESALRYVKHVVPGDRIPSEIIDGTASWTIDECHTKRAKDRLTLKLARWFSNEVGDDEHPANIGLTLERPDVKQAIQVGFAEAAVELGYGVDGREKVVGQLERLARELGYIEALRDYFQHVLQIEDHLVVIGNLLRGDKIAQEELWRVRQLSKAPLTDYRQSLANVDAQTGEILAALKNHHLVIDFVRESRDKLHETTLLWDEIIEDWQTYPSQSRKSEHLKLRKLYRFLAQNFLILDE